MKDYRIAENMECIMQGKTESLSSEDLLTVFIGSRKKAEKLLTPETNLFSGDTGELSCLAKMDVDGLMYFGLSKASAIKLAAALELAKRAVATTATSAVHITSPGDGFQYLKKLRYCPTEIFVVVLMNTKNRIMKTVTIAKGSLSSAVTHPREIFAPGVALHAASILVAHNHPSGDPYPSQEDRNLTRALEEAGNVLGIPLLDHLVIGDDRYYSFKEHGDL